MKSYLNLIVISPSKVGFGKPSANNLLFLEVRLIDSSDKLNDESIFSRDCFVIIGGKREFWCFT